MTYKRASQDAKQGEGMETQLPLIGFNFLEGGEIKRAPCGALERKPWSS